ncbi:MAG: hypothetical protein ACYCPW_08045 [Nitrososphaerales archaeon]
MTNDKLLTTNAIFKVLPEDCLQYESLCSLLWRFKKFYGLLVQSDDTRLWSLSERAVPTLIFTASMSHTQSICRNHHYKDQRSPNLTRALQQVSK